MGLFTSSGKRSEGRLTPEPPRSRLSWSSETRMRSKSSCSQTRNRRNPFLTSPVSSNLEPSQSGLSPEPMEAPPAYSPRDPACPCPPYPGLSTSPAPDSPYAFLGQFDTVFLIDDSGSMAGRSWRETEAALSAVTPVCTAHDEDGVDIYFLNHRNPAGGPSRGGAYRKITNPARVHDIFTSVSPWGGTPTGSRLGHILHPYLKRLESATKANPSASLDTIVRPLNIIVITDGIPSDDVESVIVNAARKLDNFNAPPWQIGIQFFQVGHEPDAAEELRELDDALAEQKGVRDMVDTVPYCGQNGAVPTLTGEAILKKIVLGAVHRGYDRRNALGRRERRTQRK